MDSPVGNLKKKIRLYRFIGHGGLPSPRILPETLARFKETMLESLLSVDSFGLSG